MQLAMVVGKVVMIGFVVVMILILVVVVILKEALTVMVPPTQSASIKASGRLAAI